MSNAAPSPRLASVHLAVAITIMLMVGTVAAGSATAATTRPDPRPSPCPPASLLEAPAAPATTETSEIVVPDDSRLFGDGTGTVLSASEAACADH